MKAISILVFVLSLSTSIAAQDTNYNGPAKMEVKVFWRQMGIFNNGNGGPIQITNAEKALAAVKEKDNAYNTSAMEVELNKWKKSVVDDDNTQTESSNKKATIVKAGNDAKKAGLKSDGILKYLFVDANLQVGSNTLERVKEQMDLYKAKTQEAVALDLTPIEGSKINANDYIRYIDRFNQNTDAFIKSKENYMNTESSSDGLETVLYEVQFYELYWDAAQKIYPLQSAYAITHKKMTDLIARFGSLDKMKSKIQGNKQEQIKNTKLPVGVMKDAALEKMMIDAYNKKYKSKYNGTAIKALIMQSDWSTERNQLTSVVIGRQKHMAIVYKGIDGKCYLDDTAVLYEEYIGGKFQNTQAINSLGGYEMLCDNVK